MTLVEFLLARIAEDEQDRVHDDDCRLIWMGPEHGWCDCKWSFRLPAECEAKRQIIKLFTDMSEKWNGDDPREFFFGETLNYLALPYADHPDYQEEWKP